MRNCFLVLLLTFPAAFGQTAPQNTAPDVAAPDNAAANALKQRLEGLRLLNPPESPKPIILAGPVAVNRPSICAIPLLNAIPRANTERMPVIQPKRPDPLQKGDTVQVPAPACNDSASTSLPRLQIAPVNPVLVPPKP